ncbi:unnamed protein product, partial [Rotaria sordida]
VPPKILSNNASSSYASLSNKIIGSQYEILPSLVKIFLIHRISSSSTRSKNCCKN